MGAFSIWHWIIVLVVVLVLFGGKGKLSRLMGDAARGINAFKKGLKEDKPESDNSTDRTDKAINSETSEATSSTSEKDKVAKG